MPKFKPGDRVTLTPRSRQDFEDFWKRYWQSQPGTVVKVVNSGRGGQLVYINYVSGVYIAIWHSDHLMLSAPAGTPTTVREMSYKILREVGYATV